MQKKYARKIVFILTAATSLIAAWAGAGLAWDGSYHLIQVLQNQKAYIVDARISIVPIHWVLILLSRLTDQLALLRFVYSIAYTIVPLAALALCGWALDEDHDYLFLWAGFGILAAGLPGQFFFMSEANFSMSFFWPVFILILLGVPRPRWQIPVMALLSLVILFGHPNAVILFTLLAIAVLLHGRVRPAKRAGLWLLAGFFVATGMLSFYLIPVQRQWEYSLSTLFEFVAVTLLGWPILYYALLYLTGLWCLWLDLSGKRTGLGERLVFLPGRLTRNSARVLFGLLAAAGVGMAIWALSPGDWVNALGMRRLVHFTNLPVVAFALIDWFFHNRQPVEQPEPSPAWPREQVTLALALVFAGVLVLQSLTWVGMTRRMMADLAGQGVACVSTGDLPWLADTALASWSTPSLAILNQGKAPTYLLLSGNNCEDFRKSDVVKMSPWDQFPIRDGWFDFSAVQQSIRRQP